mmetsp:Transcript_19594/g.27909  ORF Transcript_19594/g.27909 Transcript_19594/m.27909 type:complete len:104 (+) Transcript_19594:82-393(+)
MCAKSFHYCSSKRSRRIYEYDSTDELNVINQTEITNSTQNLSDSSTISFTSIPAKLDPSQPIQDQLEYHPIGIIVKISWYTPNDKVVSDTFVWEYMVVLTIVV